MILMPPGSAKSTYGSFLFPPWVMLRPNTKVLAAAHNVERAEYVSKQAKQYLQDALPLVGGGMTSDAVTIWGLQNGSEYRAAGVHERIAGTRADWGLLDDPVGSRQDADSEQMQKRTWDWYWSDFFNRLRPGAAQVLIMTRWSMGDLGGRLEEAEGDEWDMLRLPAIAEDNDPLGRAPGEFLWSDDEYGFGAKLRADFASYTRAGRARDWTAMFQQRPAPETGDYFRREWLRPVPNLPIRTSLRVYGASDYAVTADGGDWTVHVVVGMDPDGRLWLLDMWRGQASSDQWVEAFCDLVERWKPIGWAEENGQIRAGVGPFLDRRMRERRAYVARQQFPTRGDKAVRAQSIRGRMALEGLHLQADAPWRADFEAELMGFPAGKHDDIVDALGLAGQLLDQMTVAKPSPYGPDRPRDPYAQKRRPASSGWAA